MDVSGIAGSLRLDARGLDNRPPFLGLEFLQCAKRLWRLLIRRRNLQPKVAEMAADVLISHCLHSSSIKPCKMSLGVRLGAHNPNQTDMYRPGAPASSTVGISGANEIRDLAVTA